MSSGENWNAFAKDKYIIDMIDKLRTVDEIKISGNDVADMLTMLQLQQLLFYHLTWMSLNLADDNAIEANEHLAKIKQYMTMNGEGISNLHRRFADRMFSRFSDG